MGTTRSLSPYASPLERGEVFFFKYKPKSLFSSKQYASKRGVARYDLQRRFLAQHSGAMLEQCCNYPKQCRNNVATLSRAISRCCEPSRVTSPFKKLVNDSLLQATATKNRGPKSVFAYRRFQSALKFHEGCIIRRRSSILCEFPERIVSFSLSKVVSENYYWYSIKKLAREI